MAFTMIRPEEAVDRGRILEDGEEKIFFAYFGEAAERGLRPQGGLVGLRNKFLGAHNHPVDQYQVLFGKPGSHYSSHEGDVPPLVVHYADAYATYGPLSGEDPPLLFFTLRAEPTGETIFMPKDREKIGWRGRRNIHQEFKLLDDLEFPKPGGVRREAVFEGFDDGLEAFAILAGPGATFTVEASEATNGQYIVVTDGWLEYEGHKCELHSLAWQDRDEPPVELVAGPEGARVFVLRFPRPSTVERHAAAAATASA